MHQKVFEKFLDYVQGPISHNVDSTSQIKTPGAPAGRKQTPRYFGNLQMAPPKDSITSLHSSLKTIKEKKKKKPHTQLKYTQHYVILCDPIGELSFVHLL